jgi:hypothetical protein
MDSIAQRELRREQHFVEELLNWAAKNKRVLINREEYQDTINEYRTGVSAASKTPRQHYVLKKYEVIQCGHTTKLIRRRKDASSDPVYFVQIEETYDIIKACHIRTGHGGREWNGTKRCQTKKCSCYKAQLKCNSRCHSKVSCNNK